MNTLKPTAVISTGMVTGVGLSTPASCAAIRCAIDNFQETRFIARGGDWIVASEVPLDPPVRGRAKLIRMAAMAIAECWAKLPVPATHPIALLLCLAEADRPGRLAGVDESLLSDLADDLGVHLSTNSAVFQNGPIGGAQAVRTAMTLIDDQLEPFVIVAGVDTMLVAGTLTALDDAYRLLTPSNSNGLIPGEAGAAVALAAVQPQTDSPQFTLHGCGFGTETATITSDLPLKADGMSAAIGDAFQSSGCTYHDVAYRITDISGEQYAFKEASLAAARTMKQVKEEFDLWHTADCIGDIGAAIVPCMIAVAKTAAEKKYAPGDGVIFQCANDDGARSAIVGRYTSGAPRHVQ
ncbi:hypothetical protein [Stieleria mannarensis]|uniref:hypothetical protein n=1 Tax=Stieleria mannarensis TaxID=2755585 RepID=UPI001C71F7D0